jgi:phage terminase small subunit
MNKIEARRKHSRRREIQASRWTAPTQMVSIAKERTRDILRLWTSLAAWEPVDFGILAQSCYMQGINDSVDALVQRGLIIVPAKVYGSREIEVGG